MSRLLEEQTQLESRGDGRYVRAIDQGPFWGMVTPHGGYLMALMLHAMTLEVGDPLRKPRMLSQHFLGRVKPGEVELEVRVERSGRAVTSLTARMLSFGQVVGVANALFSVATDGPDFLDEPMPQAAPPEGEGEKPDFFMAPVHDRFKYHRRFGKSGAFVPVEDGGWVTPKDRGDWDYRLAILMSDIWVPPLIRHPDRMYATPSLSHVAHFGPDLDGPDGMPFLVHFGLSSGGEGVTDEEIGIWSGDGRLLVRARQLRMVVSPEQNQA
ncbi:MAG: acyl-CoA thioesterase [Myxococcota bacterium]